MMAIAVHNRSATYDLIQKTDEYVLSVPGEALVKEAMYCGVNSMNQVDKVRQLKLRLIDSATVSVPGLADAIANIEMVKSGTVRTGDHVLIIGRVNRFGVNTESGEKPLVSLGPNTTGYTLLLSKGIHRLGTVGTG
jgi:flavin reductase (DIM6/NTAB) family NADH-FMN oxidoreductase RutF